jgi:hypothetical protein
MTTTQSAGNVKLQPYLIDHYGKPLLFFPGWSHYEISMIHHTKRREMFMGAMANFKATEEKRLKEQDVKEVFSDLEFDGEDRL